MCLGVAPEVVADQLAVALVARPEGEELQPVVAGLEGARDSGRDADRVQRRDVAHVVVELDPAAAAHDDIDLLGVLMAMGEALALARLDPMKREADRLAAQVPAREARLLRLREAELR